VTYHPSYRSDFKGYIAFMDITTSFDDVRENVKLHCVGSNKWRILGDVTEILHYVNHNRIDCRFKYNQPKDAMMNVYHTKLWCNIYL